MSTVEKLILEVKVLDILVAKGDYQAANFACGAIDILMDRLDEYAMEYNYKMTRKGYGE